MAKNFRKILSCYLIKSLLIILWYMWGVKKVLQGISAFGQVVWDIGFSTCTVSIVTYMRNGIFFFQKQVYLCWNLNKYISPFCFCVLLSIQCTGYSIQHTVKKKGKAKKFFFKGKSVEIVLKSTGKVGQKRFLKNW